MLFRSARLPGPKGYVGEILPWFRGVKNANHTLTPSLARDWRKYYEYYDRIFDLEEYYFDRFTRFGRPFLSSTIPTDEIEWNYIMRHHSIPSRLLDWTKGSLIALSYATQVFSEDLDDIMTKFKRPAPKQHSATSTPDDDCVGSGNQNAAVWMLEPRRLMELATECLYPHPIRNIASRRRRVQGMRRDYFKDIKLIEERLNRRSRSRSLERRRQGIVPEKELSNPDLWAKKAYWMYPLPLIPSHISARVGSHLSRFTLHSLHSYVDTSSPPSSPPPDHDNGLENFARKAYNKPGDNFWYLVKIELPYDHLGAIARVLRMTDRKSTRLNSSHSSVSRMPSSA